MNNNKIPLTPKKKAVNKHFSHFCRHYYRGNNIQVQIQKSKINTYIHRAIDNAKKHLKTIADYPTLLQEENERDIRMIYL